MMDLKKYSKEGSEATDAVRCGYSNTHSNAQ